MNEVMERVAMLFSRCAIVRIAKGLLWLSSERGYMSSLEMEQRLFVCVCVCGCVCCVFASFCKGVVVFLLVTGLVSHEGDVSETGGGATPTDGGCSKEPLGVMNVAGVMEAGCLVYVHSSKGYCGSTRTGPRALHQLVRSKKSNTCCLYFLLLLKLLQRGLAPISQGKCGSPPMKVKLTELSISDLRHALTLN